MRFSDGFYYDLYYTGKTYPCRMCAMTQHKTEYCTEPLCPNLSCQDDYRRHSITKPALSCKEPQESEEGSLKVDNATITLPDTKKYTATPPTTTIAVTSIFAAKLRIIAQLMDDKLEFNIKDTNILFHERQREEPPDRRGSPKGCCMPQQLTPNINKRKDIKEKEKTPKRSNKT